MIPLRNKLSFVGNLLRKRSQPKIETFREGCRRHHNSYKSVTASTCKRAISPFNNISTPRSGIQDQISPTLIHNTTVSNNNLRSSNISSSHALNLRLHFHAPLIHPTPNHAFAPLSIIYFQINQTDDGNEPEEVSYLSTYQTKIKY